MKGPTICRRGEGSARRTSKPPRSRARGTMTISMARQACASPGFGSSDGSQLTGVPPHSRFDVEGSRARRPAVRPDGDLLDARVGALEERLAMRLQGLAALV